MVKEFRDIFYVKYIGRINNRSFNKNGIYKVVNVIDNYYRIIDNENIECTLEPHLVKIFPILKVKIIEKNKKQNEMMDKKKVLTLNDLLLDKVYDVISIETGFKKDDTYRIIDESEEDYLYPKEIFEIIEDNRNLIKKYEMPNVT